jgi:hypothetical protein
MDVSGQLHALAVLPPGKEPLVSSEAKSRSVKKVAASYGNRKFTCSKEPSTDSYAESDEFSLEIRSTGMKHTDRMKNMTSLSFLHLFCAWG